MKLPQYTVAVVIVVLTPQLFSDDVDSSAYDKAVRVTESAPGFRNLKEIGLAVHNYHDVMGRFPPAVCFGPTGKPYSWRVEILPLMKGDFRRSFNPRTDIGDHVKFNDAIVKLGYDTTKKWDSEDNAAFLASMPSLYLHPLDDPESTHSAYYVPVGKGTVFEDGVVSGYKEYSEKWLANTMMVTECRGREPWTKPVDVAYSEGSVIPRFGGFTPRGFLTLSCDGAVHFVVHTISPRAMRGYITTSPDDPFEIPGVPFRMN